MDEKLVLVTKKKETYSNKVIIYKTMMVICKWKKLVSEQDLKIMIAEALNAMLLEKNETSEGEKSKTKPIEILGYLITKRRVFLFVKGREKKIHEQLNVFEEYIRAELNDQRHRLGNLFMHYDLYNEDLVSLLTGRKPDLKYNSTHMNRFKRRIRNNPFCSALDYTGAKSNVNVTVKKFKDSQKI